MRRNVLGWLTGKVPDARHALVLTHNIDFLFLQSVVAPMLRRAGDPRLVVFADAACASQAFAAQSGLLDGLGDRYRVVPVDLGSARRFHPKALLLSGRAGASLAVGSGNLTHGGMSANHEAWAFAATGGEGAPLIAALRDYVTSLLPRLPLAEPLSDWLRAVFDREQAWAAGLPTPAGLVGLPAASNLLDQIAAYVHEPVRGVEVLAPYHDDRGAALAAVARRFAAPVTCWIQPGRAGLSRAAAEELPATVTLRSIDCEQNRRPSFIHAKVLALRGDARTVLAVGSANCSQAALLADGSWGNAELMAVEAVRHEAAEALFAGLVRGDVPPSLPEAPPSEGWDIPADAPLRILAARFEAGRLRIAYRAPAGVDRVRVVLSGSAQPAAEHDPVAGVVAFDVPLRPRTVSIEALAPDGTTLVSAEAWVDDEASLSAPATLRRVIQRLRDEGDTAWLPSRTFRDVLELFRDYVCDPQAARRHFERTPPRGAAQPYDPLDAFSEEFGLPSARTAGGHAGTATADLLSIVEALFAVGGAAGGPRAAPSESGNADGEDGEEPDAEAEEQRLLSLGPPRQTSARAFGCDAPCPRWSRRCERRPSWRRGRPHCSGPTSPWRPSSSSKGSLTGFWSPTTTDAPPEACGAPYSSGATMPLERSPLELTPSRLQTGTRLWRRSTLRGCRLPSPSGARQSGQPRMPTRSGSVFRPRCSTRRIHRSSAAGRPKPCWPSSTVWRRGS